MNNLSLTKIAIVVISAVFLFVSPASADSTTSNQSLFMDLLSKNSISDDELNSVGGLWFDEKGTAHLQIKSEKINSLSSNFKVFLQQVAELNVVIEEVKYSTDDLSKIMKDFDTKKEKFNLPERIMISRDDPTNGIKITSDKEISKKTKDVLADEYGENFFVFEIKNIGDFEDVSRIDVNLFDDHSGYILPIYHVLVTGTAQGISERHFGTHSPITRGDAAVMIANNLSLDLSKAEDQGFKDLNKRHAASVNLLTARGIVDGKTKVSFAPHDFITRAEMSKMITNAYNLEKGTSTNFTDVNKNWVPYVEALKNAEITLGRTNTKFDPDSNTTRGEFATFIQRKHWHLLSKDGKLGSPTAIYADFETALQSEGLSKDIGYLRNYEHNEKGDLIVTLVRDPDGDFIEKTKKLESIIDELIQEHGKERVIPIYVSRFTDA